MKSGGHEHGTGRERLSPVRVNPLMAHAGERRIRLDGEWSFRLDPDDRGVEQKWFEGADRFDELIRVPGCWQGQ